METKYKNLIIAGSVILIIVILYFLFNNNEDNSSKEGESKCPSSFTIHPSGPFGTLVSTTYSSMGDLFYKQISGQLAGASGTLPKQQISKDEFLTACNKYKNPSVAPIIE